jgi:hypothetical protein
MVCVAQAQLTEEQQVPATDEQKSVVNELAQKRLETQRMIEQQETASQGDLVADNLQASSQAVQFQVFGQTQEAINGKSIDLFHSAIGTHTYVNPIQYHRSTHNICSADASVLTEFGPKLHPKVICGPHQCNLEASLPRLKMHE